MSRMESFNTPKSSNDFELDLGLDFDINAAFEGALSDVQENEELQLEEKIFRMETIVTEANSDIYRDFVDFQSMASQIQMMCDHDHTFASQVETSDTLSNFINPFIKDQDSLPHQHQHPTHHKDEYEIDPKTGKKKKKKKKKRTSSN